MMEPELTLRPAGSLESFSSSDYSSDDLARQEPRPSSDEKEKSALRRGFSKLGLHSAGRGRPPPNIQIWEAPKNQTQAASGPGLLTIGQGGQYTLRNKSVKASTEKPLPKTPPITPGDPTPRQQDFSPPTRGAPPTPEEAKEDMTRPAYSGADTMDSTTGSTTEVYGRPRKESESPYIGNMNGAQTSFSSSREGDEDTKDMNTPRSGGVASAAPSPAQPTSAGSGTTPAAPANSSTHLSSLMCNVLRTTGREPHALVGATTTIIGDKLYVFGGKILSRTRAALTADLYELDLVRRHWTKLDTLGDTPPPRYFHSMCSLGDTKLVCYGGMSPATQPNGQPVPPTTQNGQENQPEVVVMSDIHIYDASTNTWTYIPTQDTPQGRYAHCATILPSSATFSNSSNAPLSALQHNPSSENPNQGTIGVNIDGTGGAEMVIVGGQDSANHYIEQISVFNLRSLKWTRTQQLGKSCGAYRSVVAPLPGVVSSKIGKSTPKTDSGSGGIAQDSKDPSSSMLIYSNYNFLDVKLELQIRSADGTLTEKPMNGSFTPPGLRFPNGGVIGTNFVVSGTYLTSSKQEYALWALDLRTLTWSRIDAGGNVFGQGSWNRGVLWNRRNTFVILGNRKRSLVEDYNHRRLNFSHVCMVELEAFGLYDNPRKTTPMSGFVSASSPAPSISLPATPSGGAKQSPWEAGGRTLSSAASDLGALALASKELADMDILAVGGERIPINSRIIARRWGPYFIQLLREAAATQDGNDAATLRPSNSSMSSTLMYAGSSNQSRMSSITITNFSSHTSSLSTSTTIAERSESSPQAPGAAHGNGQPNNGVPPSAADLWSPPDASTLPPASRPRALYLPHTYLTIQSLLHFLYTSSLPPSTSPLCTPQILCSLLQLARPYRVDGLVEAVVERLHAILDSRNAAAVFNAAAMAAGGGRSLGGALDAELAAAAAAEVVVAVQGPGQGQGRGRGTGEGLRINTSFGFRGESSGSEDGGSAASEGGSAAWGDEGEARRESGERGGVMWTGGVSAVIGLQKRGLRGLMEGRRLRERGQSQVGRERAVGLGIT